MTTKKQIIKKLKLGYKYIKLFFIYLPHISFKKMHNKEIVVVFDGNFGHGGIVGRLKGIVSFYAISKELNADNAHVFYLVCELLEQRTKLIEYLKQNEILAVFYYISLHSSPFYNDK